MRIHAAAGSVSVLALVCQIDASLGAVQPAPQPVDPASAMHWRHIGPIRAGRARALAGVPSSPTSPMPAAVAEARRQGAAVMARWTKLTTSDLPALNAKRKAASQPAVAWSPK